MGDLTLPGRSASGASDVTLESLQERTIVTLAKGHRASNCNARCAKMRGMTATRQQLLAIVERSPCEGIRAPTVERTRDRVLADWELAEIIRAARLLGGPYGAIVEVLALTGQRRDEVARMSWDEVDLERRIWTLPAIWTKNDKPHIVQLADPVVVVIGAQPRSGRFVFSRNGITPMGDFSSQKRRLDDLCGVSHWRLHDLRRTTVSGMARLGVAPHVADKILNHVAGTISGVAAVYQRHEFMDERRDALERWGAYVESLLAEGQVIELKAAS